MGASGPVAVDASSDGRYSGRMLHALQFVGGLVLLLFGGRLVVWASVHAARRLGVSPLVVGLTLVAWGTSAPELALNLVSALKGRGELALGNVVGANICNLGLVLGLCALIRPLQVQERLIRVEIWLTAILLPVLAKLALLSGFAQWAAGLMLSVFVVYSAWTIFAALRESHELAAIGPSEWTGGEIAPAEPPAAWWLIVVGLLGGVGMLSLGGSLASDGASGMALALGIPPAIVGVTIVSIGTTLPEAITCVLAVRKGQTDLAMGNAIGSCLFNAGAIFGLTGLLAPPEPDGTMLVPMIYMALLAIALIPISRGSDRLVSRVEGGLLLASYASFLALSAWAATSS